MAQPLLTPRLDQAIRVAAVAHREQTRKSTAVPYIVHPFAVMSIAAKATDDEDVLIACLFHDIIEDVPEMYSRDQMEEEFGSRVVEIVDGVTKDDTIKDWRGRSEAYIAHLRDASIESVMVSACDKIHNLLATLTDFETQGEKLWERFNAGKHDQLWWYESIVQVLEDRLGDSILTSELQQLVAKLRIIVEA